jgi:hypothetical protein
MATHAAQKSMMENMTLHLAIGILRAPKVSIKKSVIVIPNPKESTNFSSLLKDILFELIAKTRQYPGTNTTIARAMMYRTNCAIMENIFFVPYD